MNFAVPVRHRMKINEKEKVDIYLDLTRDLKKLWDVKVKEKPIVVVALGTVPKRMEKRQ